MKLNQAKERMLQGKPALGAVLGMGSPAVAEVMAARGFDFLLLDGQHGDWNLERAGEAFRRIFAAGSIPMVRVVQNDPFAIGSMLDRGALGVVVPMVETVEEARAAAAAARYGPRGKRSVGGSPLRNWLPLRNDEVDEEIFVAVQIETELGVENAEAILSVDGIDGCWIGPSDLELSLGVDVKSDEGRRRHTEAIQRIIRACQNAGKIPGIATPGPGNQWLAAGCLFVTVASDSSCLSKGCSSTLSTYESYRSP